MNELDSLRQEAETLKNAIRVSTEVKNAWSFTYTVPIRFLDVILRPKDSCPFIVRWSGEADDSDLLQDVP